MDDAAALPRERRRLRLALMSRTLPADLMAACAPLPALLAGVLTMRHLGVRTSAWSMNLAAAALGLLLFAWMRYSARPVSRSAWLVAAGGSIAALLLPFAFTGLEGVHRWVSVAGFGLHASAIVAPVLIACIATAPGRRAAFVVAAASVLILALQPDAAQASSVAAAACVIHARNRGLRRREVTAGVVTLIALAMASLIPDDPLKPVRHVEGIFEVVSSRGTVWMLMGTAALLLLTVPFLLAWVRRRQSLSLALGVYVAMITIAPAWGVFPVPVMGYGVSPILGYFIALALNAVAGTLVLPDQRQELVLTEHGHV
jgi:hypothetical protein